MILPLVALAIGGVVALGSFAWFGQARYFDTGWVCAMYDSKVLADVWVFGVCLVTYLVVVFGWEFAA